MTTPAILISHPNGNANVRQAILALAEGEMLRQFFTSIAWNPDSLLAAALPRRWARQLERRAYPPIVRPFLRLHPFREIARLAGGGRRLSEWLTKRLTPNACAESLDRRVAEFLRTRGGRELDLVYAYDHCALETFRAARRNGQACIYELPIGYWRSLQCVIQKELREWPDWGGVAPSIDFALGEYHRKDEEIALADVINAPSRFVQETLEEHYPGRLPPIRVIPYGAPNAPVSEDDFVDVGASRRLRVLYAGALCLRKGIPYLFSALRALGDRIECTIVGGMRADCAPLLDALGHYRWIKTLPHGELLQLMRQSDIFVFPTLFEGYGLVGTEAMSQGCALITTSVFGGVELIENGVNGFVVPSRSSEAIVDVIERLDRDRDLLLRVRSAARRTVASCSWDAYRASIRALASDETLFHGKIATNGGATGRSVRP